MNNHNSDRVYSYRTFLGQTLLAAGLVWGLLLPASAAEANIIDRVKDFYYLPENVEKMQEQYEQTKQQLEEQKEKLAEAMRLSQETEAKLLEQNRRLAENNQTLQNRLQVIEKVAQDREKLLRQIKYTGITAIILVVLYFLSSRIIRLSIWRRGKKEPTEIIIAEDRL
ncbi:MAG TPA: hypothetical protein VGE40_04390 [Bacilli bacterium]